MQIYTNSQGIQTALTEGRLSIDSDTGLPCLPVIWDTDVDGPIPDTLLDQLGGLAREGNTLVFDQATKDADDDAKLALEPGYAEKRRAEYMAIPDWEFREAIFEKEAGDSTKFEAYTGKIAEIKQRHPK
jgi:hypothetical protein